MTRPIATARHEAAHAVMAELCGFPVLEVIINKNGYGNCDFHCRDTLYDPLQLGMVTIAGHAADVLWNRSAKTKAPREDHWFLTRMGFRGRSLPTLLSIAMGVLVENEVAVMSLASELKKRDLTGKEVRKIIGEWLVE